MHIKSIIIHGFKAIRNLSFDGTFHPGHNVISELRALLDRLPALPALRKSRPNRRASVYECLAQSVPMATESPQSSMVSRIERACGKSLDEREFGCAARCAIEASPRGVPRPRLPSVGRGCLPYRTNLARATSPSAPPSQRFGSPSATDPPWLQTALAPGSSG